MKKLISLLTVCLLVIGMAVVPVSAATPKETIVNTIKSELPAAYANTYIPMTENILSQIDVTEEQAAVVLDCIKACKSVITEDKGQSLHSYTIAEREFVFSQIDKACDALNLKYEVVVNTNPVHKDDYAYVIYTADGKKLGDIDGDIVKKTNTANEVEYGFAAMALVLLAAAVAAVIYGKKAVASR